MFVQVRDTIIQTVGLIYIHRFKDNVGKEIRHKIRFTWVGDDFLELSLLSEEERDKIYNDIWRKINEEQ